MSAQMQAQSVSILTCTHAALKHARNMSLDSLKVLEEARIEVSKVTGGSKSRFDLDEHESEARLCARMLEEVRLSLEVALDRLNAKRGNVLQVLEDAEASPLLNN